MPMSLFDLFPLRLCSSIVLLFPFHWKFLSGSMLFQTEINSDGSNSQTKTIESMYQCQDYHLGCENYRYIGNFEQHKA